MGGEELSAAEREELLQLCRQRLDAFRMQRGEEVGCLLTQKPAASGTGAATAPRSAARSNTGCSPAPRAAANAAAQAVAQQTPHQRALEVDHILPRNHGGSDDLSNLQSLCFRCKSAKRDGCLATQEGSTDFRGLQASYAHRQDRCVFCALVASGRVLLENALEAVHRRCLSDDAWAQPCDPAAAWGRWVGVAPAGMERGGGAAEAAAGGAKRPGRHGQRLGWCVMTIRAGLDRAVRP